MCQVDIISFSLKQCQTKPTQKLAAQEKFFHNTRKPLIQLSLFRAHHPQTFLNQDISSSKNINSHFNKRKKFMVEFNLPNT